MKLQIESPHLEIGEKTIELVANKFDRLGRVYQRINNCDVVLRTQKKDQQILCCIEAKIEVPGAFLFSKETEKSFDSALGKLMGNLEHQLQQYRQEFQDRR